MADVRIVLVADNGVVLSYVYGDLATVQSRWPWYALESETAQPDDMYDAQTNTFYTPAPPPPAQLEADAVRVRKALNHSGQRQSVEDWVAQQDQDVKDEWDHAPTFYNNQGVILGWALSQNMQQENINAIFYSAQLQ